MGFNPRKAQAAGIDVQQVLDSWQHHLLAERDKHRQNPLLVTKGSERLSLAVSQVSNASGLHWASLGGLPEGVEEVKVSATSFEGARNSLTVRQLVEQRFRKGVAEAMQRAGLYHGHTLEGRRDAMARAIDASVDVADFNGLV